MHCESEKRSFAEGLALTSDESCVLEPNFVWTRCWIMCKKEKASQKSLFQQMKQQWVQSLHKHGRSFSSLGFFCNIISALTFIALGFVLNKMRSTDHIELLPQDAPFLQCGGGLCDDRVLQRHHGLTQPRVGKKKRNNLGSILRELSII